ncbi:MAG: hypothetical protein GF311_26635 [Candidatus Lokiarchaeota archaeon]|nr:hypothetical protein [Candidatus Lokiarchaeota archaeon]
MSNTKTDDSSIQFCPWCGTKIEEFSTTCINCEKPIQGTKEKLERREDTEKQNRFIEQYIRENPIKGERDKKKLIKAIEKFREKHGISPDSSIPNEALEGFGAKLKDVPKKLLGAKAIILYLFDPHAKEFVQKPMSDVMPVVRLNEFGEIFVLDRPAMYIGGKPYFICQRGYPVSCTFQFDTEKHKMVELGRSSGELDAKTSSAVTERAWRALRLSPAQMVIAFMACAMSILITYIICLLTMKPGAMAPPPEEGEGEKIITNLFLNIGPDLYLHFIDVFQLIFFKLIFLWGLIL